MTRDPSDGAATTILLVILAILYLIFGGPRI
jgi:hypothetical protein